MSVESKNFKAFVTILISIFLLFTSIFGTTIATLVKNICSPIYRISFKMSDSSENALTIKISNYSYRWLCETNNDKLTLLFVPKVPLNVDLVEIEELGEGERKNEKLYKNPVGDGFSMQIVPPLPDSNSISYALHCIKSENDIAISANSSKIFYDSDSWTPINYHLLLIGSFLGLIVFVFICGFFSFTALRYIPDFRAKYRYLSNIVNLRENYQQLKIETLLDNLLNYDDNKRPDRFSYSIKLANNTVSKEEALTNLKNTACEIAINVKFTKYEFWSHINDYIAVECFIIFLTTNIKDHIASIALNPHDLNEKIVPLEKIKLNVFLSSVLCFIIIPCFSQLFCTSMVLFWFVAGSTLIGGLVGALKTPKSEALSS